MTKDFKILTSHWFIIGLTVLLLNDLILKGLYGNLFTGKISDFAGLFIFPLFWTSLLPRHKANIFWLTFIFFVLWKSPYSQTFIDFWNKIALYKISRTVDYTDLIALTVLPIASRFHTNRETAITFKLNPVFPLVISAFAFIATSYRTDLPLSKTYKFQFPKDTLINRLNRIDSLNHGYEVKFSTNDTDTVDFTVPSTFCFTNFEVKIAVTKVNDNATDLILISAEHRCPEGERDRDEVTKEFENLVIRRIKNGL